MATRYRKYRLASQAVPSHKCTTSPARKACTSAINLRPNSKQQETHLLEYACVLCYRPCTVLQTVMAYTARENMPMTSPTLLSRLRDPHDQEAWDTLFEFYWGLIVSFARQRGCSYTTARDVLQETLLTLTRTMPDFHYDPGKGRFRSYLLTIVKNHIVDAFRREQKYINFAQISPGQESGREFEIPDENADEITQQWEEEWNRQLLRTALNRVRERLEPETYESFKMYVLEKTPVQTVCDRLNIDRNLLYQHKHRIINMLKKETLRLRRELEDDPHAG